MYLLKIYQYHTTTCKYYIILVFMSYLFYYKYLILNNNFNIIIHYHKLRSLVNNRCGNGFYLLLVTNVARKTILKIYFSHFRSNIRCC